MTDQLSDEERATLRALHHEVPAPPFANRCAQCSEPWPCTVVRLLAERGTGGPATHAFVSRLVYIDGKSPPVELPDDCGFVTNARLDWHCNRPRAEHPTMKGGAQKERGTGGPETPCPGLSEAPVEWGHLHCRDCGCPGKGGTHG